MEPDGSLPLSQLLPLVPALSQISPVLISQSHFLKIYFSFVLPSISGFSELSLSHWYPHQSPVFTSLVSYMCRVTFSAHLLLLDVIIRKINIWWGLLPATGITAICETNTRGRGYLCIFPTENASITTLSAIYVTVAEEIPIDGFQRKSWSSKPPVPYFNRKRLHYIFLPTFCTHFFSMTQ